MCLSCSLSLSLNSTVANISKIRFQDLFSFSLLVVSLHHDPDHTSEPLLKEAPTGTTNTLMTTTLDDLKLHTWTPKEKPRAVCVIFHGFLAHGRYPTVRYAAELLSENGCVVYAADMKGHGESPGTKGYIESADQWIDDGSKVAKHAQAQHEGLPLFLVGSSMGGTVALLVAEKISVSGVVLLAPMLKLKVSSIEASLLSMLNVVCSGLRLIPSSSTNSEKQCRDPVKRQECDEDVMTTKSSYIYVGSANTAVQMTQLVPQTLQPPVLLLVADEDVVVSPQGSVDWFESLVADDKTMKRYPALHALLCEPSPLVEQIGADLVAWVKERMS